MTVARPQRPFACKPVSVGNVSVTGHSTVNYVERQLPDQKSPRFRPQVDIRGRGTSARFVPTIDSGEGVVVLTNA